MGVPDDAPDYRLTVRRGEVRAIDWNPWLAAGGPMAMLLQGRDRAGVAIADVTLVRAGDVAVEAMVRFLAGDRPAAREALRAWAHDVGYRRLWLPGEVLELPGPGEGLAETRCSGCAARFADADPGFWSSVRTCGRFPAMCPLCGGDLPQWRVRREAGTGERGAAPSRSARAQRDD
ncbi:MAG: hypothetical protein QOD55_2068 [Solirubrobacteraceae bacterium]|jgi:hypothetical protein|nr:hypothetical protein [Solirubrobacteraceae bacterium]MEA2290071.1 hypothetical protein [Solirubrobacteraceae bacterium]